MKNAYIIYHPAEAEKNKNFIQMFQKAGKKYGIEFSLCYPDPSAEKGIIICETESRGKDCAGKWYDTEPDLVLNRTRDPQISRMYEKKGIPVFHSANMVELANNKYKMIEYFREHLPAHITKKKWCPDTILWTASKDKVDDGFERGVIKSVEGHGGNEVFLAEDREKWEKSLLNRPVILQEKIECHSRDLRVYVLFGEIYCVMLRQGTRDFRSNFSLGGSVQKTELTQEQKEYVRCFIRCLPEYDRGMYSVDFLPLDDGTLLFDEVEEMVGCRMLYQYTDRDIVDDYVSGLAQQK